MTAFGPGYMCKIDEKMVAKLYVEILGDEWLKFVDWYGMDRRNFIFQQDNDPKHTSKLAKKWIENHEIEVLAWP